MFGAIAGGIASALAGGAMSKLFGGGQKAASGGIQGDVLATDNNTVGMGDAGIKSAIQGSNVPNPDKAFGRRVRNRRQLNSLQNTWPYGYSMPIAVRYTQDAFSRSGWLWPVDAKGEPLKATSY